MKWQLISVLIFAVMAFGRPQAEPTPKPYDEPEVYAVYAAALTLDHAKGELMISDTTAPFDQCLDSRSNKLVDAAINDYKDKNKTRWRLQSEFKLKQRYKLLSSDEIGRLVQKDSKSGFFWSFPEGTRIIRFSAVGFSADRTIAFVEMDSLCGGLCGHGSPFILQKKDGKWHEYSPQAENPDGSIQIMSVCSWAY